MSASFCWWCGRPLVGPGGVPRREPLFFREVQTTDDGQRVRVHVQCEPETIKFFTVETASLSTRLHEGEK